MTRDEFLRRIENDFSLEVRRFFDRLFRLTGERFRTGNRPGDRGYDFSLNEEEGRTLQTPAPERNDLIAFRIDRSLLIDPLGMEVRLDSPERMADFSEVYPAILNVLARREGLE